MLNQSERNDAREIAKRSEQTELVVYSEMGILVPLALLDAEAELAAAKAEVERLTKERNELAQWKAEAELLQVPKKRIYQEGYEGKLLEELLLFSAQKESDAKKALEETT
jgi:hypothetical protein